MWKHYLFQQWQTSMPFWWLPLPILQNTTLITVNQPLANCCLLVQNQQGTKTGQNHRKIKSRTLCPKYPCGIPLYRLQRYKFVPWKTRTGNRTKDLPPLLSNPWFCECLNDRHLKMLNFKWVSDQSTTLQHGKIEPKNWKSALLINHNGCLNIIGNNIPLQPKSITK